MTCSLSASEPSSLHLPFTNCQSHARSRGTPNTIAFFDVVMEHRRPGIELVFGAPLAFML
jgi:hypothetical protein